MSRSTKDLRSYYLGSSSENDYGNYKITGVSTVVNSNNKIIFI